MKIDKNKTLMSIDIDKDIDDNGLCVIPFGVRTIYNDVFRSCQKLVSVVIPNSVEIIETGVFLNCTNLKSVNIPNGVSEIRDYTFYGCQNLTSVNLTNNLEIIGFKAFSGCCNLKSLELPRKLSQIRNHAFEFTGLEYLKIPSSVAWVGGYAFYHSNLKEIVFSDGIKTIECCAFLGCENLQKAKVPDSIKTIADAAFDCSSLRLIETNKPELFDEAVMKHAYDKVNIVPLEDERTNKYSLSRGD